MQLPTDNQARVDALRSQARTFVRHARLALEEATRVRARTQLPVVDHEGSDAAQLSAIEERLSP